MEQKSDIILSTNHYTINDTLPDGERKKAKIILLGGQSNASGCSRDDYLNKNANSEKYFEYLTGYNNVYINFFVSGTNESKVFTKCTVRQGEGKTCFGPELGIAERLNEKYPDELFFIIKYAWGATNLCNQWLSPSSNGKTGALYLSFINFVESSLYYLISKNYDIEIKSMCWMQGESDSLEYESAIKYKENLINLINDIRNHFSQYAAKDGIAFIDAYISDCPECWTYGQIINESKKVVSKLLEMDIIIDTISEGLTTSKEPYEQPDIAHYDSLSQIKLGHLFAEAIMKFLK